MKEQKRLSESEVINFVHKLLVNKKYTKHQIYTVIKLTIKEVLEDLKTNKKYTIYNFGKFIAKDYPARKYFHPTLKEHMTSRPFTKVKFIMKKKLKVLLKKNIDVEKTFKEENE